MVERFYTEGIGTNRRKVLENAIQRASQWYEADIRCIHAELTDEVSVEETYVSAEVVQRIYRAEVVTLLEHDWEYVRIGVCSMCGAKNEDER